MADTDKATDLDFAHKIAVKYLKTVKGITGVSQIVNQVTNTKQNPPAQQNLTLTTNAVMINKVN